MNPKLENPLLYKFGIPKRPNLSRSTRALIIAAPLLSLSVFNHSKNDGLPNPGSKYLRVSQLICRRVVCGLQKVKGFLNFGIKLVLGNIFSCSVSIAGSVIDRAGDTNGGADLADRELTRLT